MEVIMNRFSRLTSISIILLLLASPLWAGPHLKLTETEFDFGYAAQNSKMSYPFWLYSNGDEDLQIVRINSDCGCTEAPLEKETVAPGDSAKLEVIFSSRKFSKKVVKHINVRTSASPHSEKLAIKAYVLGKSETTQPVIVDPLRMDFSERDGKAPDYLEYEISNVSDQDLHIRMVCASNGYVKIKLPREVRAGESVSGSVSITKEGIDKSFAKSFTFELDDADSSRFTVAIWRQLQKDEEKPPNLPERKPPPNSD
jgi:hypothetical protein